MAVIDTGRFTDAYGGTTAADIEAGLAEAFELFDDLEVAVVLLALQLRDQVRDLDPDLIYVHRCESLERLEALASAGPPVRTRKGRGNR